MSRLSEPSRVSARSPSGPPRTSHPTSAAAPSCPSAPGPPANTSARQQATEERRRCACTHIVEPEQPLLDPDPIRLLEPLVAALDDDEAEHEHLHEPIKLPARHLQLDPPPLEPRAVRRRAELPPRPRPHHRVPIPIPVRDRVQALLHREQLRLRRGRRRAAPVEVPVRVRLREAVHWRVPVVAPAVRVGVVPMALRLRRRARRLGRRQQVGLPAFAQRLVHKVRVPEEHLEVVPVAQVFESLDRVFYGELRDVGGVEHVAVNCGIQRGAMSLLLIRRDDDELAEPEPYLLWEAVEGVEG